MVNEILKILNRRKKLDGKIINIGSGKHITIKNLVKLIQSKIGGGKPDFGAIKMKQTDIKKSYASTNKIKKLINWKPKISLNIGINLLIKER